MTDPFTYHPPLAGASDSPAFATSWRWHWPWNKHSTAAQLTAQILQLRESRREIVEAFEIERRRIERDLHDGTQQFLVATGLKLGEAAYLASSLSEQQDPNLGAQLRQLQALLDEALAANEEGLRALRRTVTGVHPRQLQDLGLEAAVRQLAASSPVRVRLRCPHPLPQMPLGVATSAYYLVSEALTNIAKYAPQAAASVLLIADANLRVSVVDDGPGGAFLRPGGGLEGLGHRLSAFGGFLRLDSPPDGPTTVAGQLPLLVRQGEGPGQGPILPTEP